MEILVDEMRSSDGPSGDKLRRGSSLRRMASLTNKHGSVGGMVRQEGALEVREEESEVRFGLRYLMYGARKAGWLPTYAFCSAALPYASGRMTSLGEMWILQHTSDRAHTHPLPASPPPPPHGRPLSACSSGRRATRPTLCRS